MKIRTFSRGGVHPDECKLTAELATVVADLPNQAVFPLSQHIGAPAKPLVKKGDKVKVGTMIAEAGGYVSAPVYSSVSGTVWKVDSAIDATGYQKPAIIINVEGDEWEESIDRTDTLETVGAHPELTPEEIVARVQRAGVTGMGGAGFPTHVKLCPPPTAKAECVILNGVECEPYITSDYRLMLERGEAVIGGARLLAKALGAPKTVIAVETDKPEALELLRARAGGEEELRIQPLPNRYPQGAEKPLIQALMGRKIPAGKLPVETGCLVSNVATAAAVWEAVMEGKPLTRRYVTVTGGALREPMNFIVPVGTPVSWLIKLAGGFQAPPDRVLLGGPMLGTPLYDLDAPVMKTTNCVLCLTGDEVGKQDPAQSCIRCGKCVEVCPMKLAPLFVWMNAGKRNWEATRALHAADCIECGCCSYICPARIPLVQSFRMAKAAFQEESRSGAGTEENREKEGAEE